MAQLGGRTIRTLVTSLEALSDDGKLVLMFDREESGNVKIRTRLPWESAWANNGSSFQLGARNASTSAMLAQQRWDLGFRARVEACSLAMRTTYGVPGGCRAPEEHRDRA